ncbi:MAG: hypothetical protein OSB05_00880 [Akkermansiaceae bacterium]|nr:hypothetical protein [Akkermansiaceae bacterium]
MIIILFGLWFFLAQRAEDDPAPPTPEKQVESIVKTPAEPRRPVLADTMLANYGTDESSGKEDFRKLTTFLDSVFLLVKKRDTADYATNEDLALFLKGSNPHQTAFLSADSPALNKEGQLIDRWGSPIIVHPISRKLLEIRSAGPDQKPYTEDDFLWPNST